MNASGWAVVAVVAALLVIAGMRAADRPDLHDVWETQ